MTSERQCHHLGPWLITYTPGNRLGDIYGICTRVPVDCVQVAEYDFVKGEVVPGTADPIRALAEWVAEHE